MLFKSYSRKCISVLSVSFPYLMALAVLIVFCWMLANGKFNSAIRGLVIAVPTVISCYYIINFKENSIDFNEYAYFSAFKKANRASYLFWIIYFASVNILLLNDTRPWYYFLFISAAYLIIFIQIFSKNEATTQILIELFFLMLNLIYSVTLKYGLYFGTTDLLPHIFMSQITYISGHVIPQSLSNYAYFPLYHILISEASYILNLDVKTSLFVITAPIYAITAFFIYYIFLRIIKNQQIALLSCALYSSSSIVVYYGVNVITRTMAFIGFIIILYFAYSDREGNDKIKFKFLSLLFSVFLILTHQVSIPQILLIFTVLFVSEWLTQNKSFISSNYFVLLNVLFISYWFFVAYLFVQNELTARLQSHFLDSVVILPGSTELVKNEWINTLGLFDDSIFLFFALLAIGYFLKYYKNTYASAFGLVALFTLILYIPSPLNNNWQLMVLFRVDRMMLFISPFMAFVMGVGIYLYLVNNMHITSRTLKNKFPLVFILLSFFVFVSLVYSVSDSNDLWINSRHEYFNDKELNGFNYICSNVPFGSPIYSDYATVRYLPLKFEDSEKLGVPYYKTKKIKDADSIASYNGYIILREQEFLSKGLYFGLGELEIEGGSIYLYQGTKENKEALYSRLESNSKVYSNSAISLYTNLRNLHEI